MLKSLCFHLYRATESKPHIAQRISKQDPKICPRDDTVFTLAQDLDAFGVITVQGTRLSGKTTLALLLRNFLGRTRKVVFISGWKSDGDDMKAKEFLVKKCHENGYNNIEGPGGLPCDTNSDLVFIIDDAQEIQKDDDLWVRLIETRYRQDSGPHFCLFGTSGYLNTLFSICDPHNGLIAHRQQRVGLTAQSIAGASKVSLFYKKHEFQDAVSKIFGNDAYSVVSERDWDFVYSFTNGHPGMVAATVAYLCLRITSTHHSINPKKTF
ncbi:hypothetical protein BO71DRAFT_95665 [Aspergillus ellipticus CBS 707.79]|uniref:AAA+ ATPase domain-containing protein n=1 Tax=Aspergillus ellipticus CBS 707.79 TaxID=1448320 RepID=A0A319DK66_9EURO|nr:hypothetical protein BO71DRAFT_95665 [Aspergillus ellipticus CBS 707.79]